jgi:hypothetical protein
VIDTPIVDVMGVSWKDTVAHRQYRATITSASRKTVKVLLYLFPGVWLPGPNGKCERQLREFFRCWGVIDLGQGGFANFGVSYFQVLPRICRSTSFDKLPCQLTLLKLNHLKKFKVIDCDTWKANVKIDEVGDEYGGLKCIGSTLKWLISTDCRNCGLENVYATRMRDTISKTVTISITLRLDNMNFKVIRLKSAVGGLRYGSDFRIILQLIVVNIIRFFTHCFGDA